MSEINDIDLPGGRGTHLWSVGLRFIMSVRRRRAFLGPTGVRVRIWDAPQSS